MEPEFDQSLQATLHEAITSVLVHDTIAIPGSGDKMPNPGLAVILDSFPCDDPDRFIGQWARIRVDNVCSDPRMIRAVRDHRETISFFFEGLTKADVPNGSYVEFAA